MGVGFRYRLEDSGTERSKRKRMRLLGRARNVCPHIHSIDPAGEAGNPDITIQFAVETVFGEMGYHCTMCGSRWSRHGTDLLRDSVERAFERTRRDHPRGLQVDGEVRAADPQAQSAWRDTIMAAAEARFSWSACRTRSGGNERETAWRNRRSVRAGRRRFLSPPSK